MRDHVRVAFALIEDLLESWQHFRHHRAISVSFDSLKLIELTAELNHNTWPMRGPPSWYPPETIFCRHRVGMVENEFIKEI